MQNLSQANITDAVVQTFANTPNPRLYEIMTSLVKHLHAFVREVNLTEEEWLAGIMALTRSGHMTDERRQEFILWSDVLGVSALKDFLAHEKQAGVTEWSLLGPFYRAGAVELPLDANLAGDAPGETLFVTGHVLTPDGKPIAHAVVDTWQSDAEGFYDLQKMDAQSMNLRGRFRADEHGEFRFRTIRPSFYPIPYDGPVGDMLKATGRHPYRPAHLHFRLWADGFKPLTTELYLNGDPYLDSDAVFGVRRSLIVDLEQRNPPDGAPYYTVSYDFVLQQE